MDLRRPSDRGDGAVQAQRRNGQSVEIAVREDGTNNPASLERMAAAGVEVTWPFRGHHRHRSIQPWIVIRRRKVHQGARVRHHALAQSPLDSLRLPRVDLGSSAFGEHDARDGADPADEQMGAGRLPRSGVGHQPCRLGPSGIGDHATRLLPAAATKKLAVAENGIGLGRYFAVQNARNAT